jgi:hypothetical protein
MTKPGCIMGELGAAHTRHWSTAFPAALLVQGCILHVECCSPAFAFDLGGAIQHAHRAKAAAAPSSAVPGGNVRVAAWSRREALLVLPCLHLHKLGILVLMMLEEQDGVQNIVSFPAIYSQREVNRNESRIMCKSPRRAHIMGLIYDTHTHTHSPRSSLQSPLSTCSPPS